MLLSNFKKYYIVLNRELCWQIKLSCFSIPLYHSFSMCWVASDCLLPEYMCLCLSAGELGYPAHLSTDKVRSIPHPGSLLQINAQIKPFPSCLLASRAPRLILIIKIAVANYFRGFGQCYVCVDVRWMYRPTILLMDYFIAETLICFLSAIIQSIMYPK